VSGGSAEELLAGHVHVAAVELIKLPRYYDDVPTTLVTGFGGTVLARITGEDAEQILQQLKTLDPAEQMRCHAPVYGFRLIDDAGRVLEIAICFRCNNARTLVDGVTDWFTLDGSSATAQALLDLLRSCDEERDAAIDV
jgi:hypothetical protein